MFTWKLCCFNILLHIIRGAHVSVSLENEFAAYDVQGKNKLVNEVDGKIMRERDDGENDGQEGLDLCVSDPNSLGCQNDGSADNRKIQ